ncbi:hypothetical protein ABZ070_09620 [Streptomyces sp. NPDC006283]|uniref:hypothetical protein n=1 Tax=Streptomyces sp. NPDC006283 TaxID=3156741 RepID=UPI0033A626C0
MATARATTPRDQDRTGPEGLFGDWLTRGKDGVLTVWAPADGAVLRWTESASGWSGPERLPAPGLLPLLTVAQGADGYVHLVGMRRAGDGDEVELVHAVQFQTGRPLLGWHSLGHPNKVARFTGHPATAVDGAGRLCLFLRNGGTGVSCRIQGERGGWGRWQDLGGSGVGEILAAAADGEGLVEVFVPDQKSIARYTQEKRGAPFSLADRLDVRSAPGAFSALATTSGSVSLFFTDEDGAIQVWAPQREPDPRPLMEAAGSGPLALTRTVIDGYDCTILAQEADRGRVAFAAYPTEEESAGSWWTHTSTGASQVPLALREQASGGLIALALDDDGRPIATRQKTEAGGFALGRWKPLT